MPQEQCQGWGGSPSFRHHQSQAQSLVSLSLYKGGGKEHPGPLCPPCGSCPATCCLHPPPQLFTRHTIRPLCPGACWTVPPHPCQAVPGSLRDCWVLGGNRRDLLVVIFLKQVIDLLVISFHRDIPCP